MAEIIYSENTVANLQGKVVVLTGGAQGIGAATTRLAYSAGAHVFIGDWEEDKGTQLVKNLQADDRLARRGGSVTFIRVDVRDYQMQLALFDTAYRKHGHVDIAVSCAAVGEPRGWFEPDSLDLETVRQEPLPVKDRLDIILTSVLLFSRLALAFMKPSTPLKPPSDPSKLSLPKSIVLVSSIAGITEAPGLFTYSTAKHGIIGLMRALRPWAPFQYGVRANAICPWATDTQLLAGVKERWEKEKLPMNTPEDVARMILQCAADPDVNGKAVFVAGGRGFDTEQGIEETQGTWMGEKNSVDFNRGQRVLGMGDNWGKVDKGEQTLSKL